MNASSIRKRLLIAVLFIVTVFWVLVEAVMVFSIKDEVDEMFDSQLAQAAAMVAEISLTPLHKYDGEPLVLSRSVFGHKYERKISFQIWRDGRLLARSQSAPAWRVSPGLGYSAASVNGHHWHLFGLQEGDYVIYAGEDYEIRRELLENILIGSSVLLLMALPIIAAIIWFAIRRGLAPLTRLAREVRRRSPAQLQPIHPEGAPVEVAPLVSSLNTLLARLEDALERERRFTADASHEMRTPLAAIKTQAQVALRARNDREMEQALRGIVRGVDRISHLMEQMLILARLEPDQKGGVQELDLKQVVEKEVADLGKLAREKGVDLTYQQAGERDAWVFGGHKAGISVLVRNLVDNAVRYTPEGGKVIVLLEDAGDAFVLRVSDNGVGVPMPDRARIFDRFHRQLGQDSDGCGLGLSIVKRIVELHHAGLAVEDSPLGSGLSVVVRFPAGRK